MKRQAAIVLAVIAGASIGWAAGHLGVVLGGAELVVAGVLSAVLEMWLGG